MKIIIDTNVLISGIFFTGSPFEVLKAWRDGKIQLILSHEFFSEYVRVLEKISQKYPEIDIDDILELIAINSNSYQPIEFTKQICEDPDDDKFITCALSSKTYIIVSGDNHLLLLSGYKNIEIIKPKTFVNKYL